MSSLNQQQLNQNQQNQQDQQDQGIFSPVTNVTNKRQHSNSYMDQSTKRSVLDPSASFKTSYFTNDTTNDKNNTHFKSNYTINQRPLISPSPNPSAQTRKFATFTNPTYNNTDISKNIDASERAIPSSTPPPPSFASQRLNTQQQPLVSNASDTSSIPDTSIQTQQQQGMTSNPTPQQLQQQQQQQQQQKLTTDEQVLINKLQDSYKIIIGLENDIQKKCSSLNLSMRLDMTELWDIYNLNVHLLNSYHDFLLYSLNSGKSGKQIVQIYRIQRRLWVYGIVTFLDVLKNVVSIFIEHDICSSFIAFAFNILTGLANISIDSWIFEKIGDLSRMAIALYPSRYIDWKLSSEYWYHLAMKLNYGQGKIYYHVATVQQDNLDALMNIGKAVFSRETFVPTAQYMKMVIDNINQRQYVDQPVMDFIRLHKIILNDEVQNAELNKLIDLYVLNLGKDNNNVNFFQKNGFHVADIYENKLQFWFQRSSSFALVNILQICGFGNPTSPFAKLFGLLDALKERKDRKEKKDKKKSSADSNSDSASSHSIPNWSSDEWFASIDNINLYSLKLSMKMFQSYLQGPIESALPHVITYLYFLVAIGKSIEVHPESKDFFEFLMQVILPLDSLVDHLNSLLKIAQDEFWDEFTFGDSFYDNDDPNFWIDYFNNNETIYEVWKCWGTLWFDRISLKQEYDDFRSSGILNDDFLDIPVSGNRYEPKSKNQRILRILLLACYISQHHSFGIKRDVKNFKVFISSPRVSRHQQIIDKFAFLNIIEPASPTNMLLTQPITIPISQWLKQSSNPTNVPESPNSISNNIYYTDNEADYENSTTSTPSIPASINQHNTSTLISPPTEITNETLFVLDTNMWLKHCGRLFKSLRSRIFTLGIPLVVFQELRSLRCSQDATVADAATRAVIALRQLTAEGLINPMKMNGEFINNINDIKDFENHNGWMDGVDSIIIVSIVIRREGIIITEDKNMRIQAKMKKVNSYNGEWFWRLVETLSEGKCDD